MKASAPFFLLFFLSMLCSGCTSFFFQPRQELISTPKKQQLQYEESWITTTDGTLHGWRVPAQGKEKGVVLFMHGNAGNISYHWPGIAFLPKKGWTVYLFDYRGYGKSQGIAHLNGAITDTQSMVDAVINENPQQRIHIIGHSLGASLLISALADMNEKNKQRIGKIILLAPFSDYRSVARDFMKRSWLTRGLRWPLSYLISNHYRPDYSIARLSPMPVWLFHGDHDQVIPPQHSLRLYQAAKPPKYRCLVPTGHNDILQPIVQTQILQLLSSINDDFFIKSESSQCLHPPLQKSAN